MDVMKALEGTATHLQAHWRAYLPAVGAVGALMFLGIGAMLAGAIGLAIAGNMLGIDDDLGGLLVGLGAMGMFGVLIVLMAPVSLYLARLTIALEDDALPPTLPGMRESIESMVLVVIVLFAYAVGTMMCVLPGLVASAATSIAYVYHAQGSGVFESLRRSVAAFQKAPLQMFVLLFVLQMVASGLMSLPIIGVALVLPVISVGLVMGWREVERQID